MSKENVGVFLDRDGTINVEVDFVRTPDQLQLIPGAAKAIRQLNEHGLTTCIISNQSGIARGLLSEDDLILIHDRLRQELAKEGARIDAIYYCPHHPTIGNAPYVRVCECRKPGTAMLQWGEKEFNLNLARSFVVGDRLGDIGAGKAVGATTVLVRTGYGEQAVPDSVADGVNPDFVAADVVEAVRYILHTLEGRQQR